MNKQALSVIDPTRVEFGYSRTVCACSDCAAGCRHLPGYLVPADIARLHDHLAPGEDLFAWTREHLLASPGALVERQGKVFRIRTLVPARRADGACHLLTDDGLCGVHAVAPFGCAFFDVHISTVEADLRSSAGLRAVLEVWLQGGNYADVWRALAAEGLVAPPPEEGRARLQQATRENGSA